MIVVEPGRAIVGPFFAQPPQVEHFTLLAKSADVASELTTTPQGFEGELRSYRAEALASAARRMARRAGRKQKS